MQQNYKGGIEAGFVDGEIRYHLVDDKATSFIRADTFMSDSFGDHLKLSCLPRTEEWYRSHHAFNIIQNSNTLKMISFNSNKSIVIVERIDYTLNEWLARKLLSNKKKGDKTDKNHWVKHYTDPGHRGRWWGDIESDLHNIFGPPISGIRVLHSHGLSHGNVISGIAIRQETARTVKGLLFDMVDVDDQTQELLIRQKKDVQDLIDLIRYALAYPFQQPGSMSQRPHLPDKITQLCLRQLSDRAFSINPNFSRERLHWDLNPVIFWDEREKIRFLTAMHRVLFRYTMPNTMRKTAEYHFKEKKWINRVVLMGTQEMNAVLEENKNPATGRLTYEVMHRGMQKLNFWRNCIEHAIAKAATGPVSRMGIHVLVLQAIPELISEVVAVAGAIIKDPVYRFSSQVQGLFEEMDWS